MSCESLATTNESDISRLYSDHFLGSRDDTANSEESPQTVIRCNEDLSIVVHDAQTDSIEPAVSTQNVLPDGRISEEVDERMYRNAEHADFDVVSECLEATVGGSELRPDAAREIEPEFRCEAGFEEAVRSTGVDVRDEFDTLATGAQHNWH